MGTLVAEGKPVVNVDGKDYLLEKPLGADIALLGASIADESGNLVYKGTTQNFNPVMAMAADLVIVEAEKVVPVGEIAPEAVHTPGIFVNYIYKRHAHELPRRSLRRQSRGRSQDAPALRRRGYRAAYHQ